jgi:hypothetical protein
MTIYTVKAFKPKPPFDLILEELPDFDQAIARFNELCKDPEIDAAYLYQDGQMAYDYHEAYDYYLDPELEPTPYKHYRNRAYLPADKPNKRPYQLYVWQPKGGEDFTGDFVPASDNEGHSVGKDRDHYVIRGINSHGQQCSFIELYHGPMPYEFSRGLFDTVRQMLEDIYDATRLVQAGRMAIGKDDEFARLTLETAQQWLMQVLDRKEIEVEE